MTLTQRVVLLAFLMILLCTGSGFAATVIVLGAGDDSIELELGDYSVYGGGGIDTVGLPLFPDEYQFTQAAINQYTARFHGFISLFDSVEYVEFGTTFKTRLPIAELLYCRVQEQLAKLADLYLAFFGRAPDVSGLEYWQERHLEQGRDTTLISMDFSWSLEAQALFPTGLSNRDFVKTVYQNCFGRDPDAEGWDYWTIRLDQLDPQDPNYLNERGAFVGELLLGAYAETSGVEDRRFLINRHEVALYYVNRLSTQLTEGFDPAINDLLDLVTMDNSTRYNAEHVIDHFFANSATLSEVMGNQTLLSSLWVHDPVYDSDDDGDGWTEVEGDCNDSLTSFHPEAKDICGDGFDQDCSGSDLLCPVSDPQNYIPFELGRTWVYRGTDTEPGGAAVFYDNVLTVVGEKAIDGVKTTVFHEANPDNTGASQDFYLYKDTNGVRYYGSYPPDTLTSQLVPYQEISFQIKVGESFVQIDKSGLDFGEDLDGDSVNEQVDVYSQVTFVGMESQTVPAGTFKDSAELQTDMMMKIHLSRSNSWVTATGLNSAWYAPGTGPIKSTSLITLDGYSETVTEELTGYYTLLAADLSPANSDSEYPGKPSVGYDGTNYLVISRRVISPTDSVIIGVIVSADGEVLKNFDITPGDTDWSLSSNRLDVAFDGHNYLVVFGRNGQIIGIRVTPEGQVLDGPSGVVITSSGTNAFPVVDFDGTNFLVVWAKYLSDYDIYGALVSPEGQVQEEFPVFTAIGDQITPAIAFNGHNYLVAWGDSHWDGTASVVDIYATRVSPAGVPLDSTGIPLCTTEGYQGEPDLASDGSNYFAVWADGRVYASEIGQIPELDIYGARITSEGNLLDPGGLPINTVSHMASNGKANPTVAFNGTDYFVSWQTGSFPDFLPAGIFASWVTTTGVVKNPSVGEDGLSMSGSPTTYASYVYPVAGSGTGSVFLAWVNLIELSGESKDLYGKVVMHHE